MLPLKGAIDLAVGYRVKHPIPKPQAVVPRIYRKLSFELRLLSALDRSRDVLHSEQQVMASAKYQH